MSALVNLAGVAEARAASGAATKGVVLLVGNFLSASLGIHGVCEDLAVRLRESQWSVVTTSHRSGRFGKLKDMLTTVWKERRNIDAAQIDVFSGHAFVWAEAVCAMLDHVEVPYALTLHGGDLPEFSARWPQRVRRLLSRAKVVTAPSAYLHQRMLPYHDGIVTIPNPIELRRYPLRTRSRIRPHLVWLRAFHAVYNPVLAPRAAAELVREIPEIRVDMYGADKGDGSLAATKQESVRLGVDGRVVCHPAVAKSDVPAVMSSGDIFLNTTNVDNTPVSVIEAMACGMCVVSTNVGGIPYLLQDGVNALLTPPNDAAAMAGAIRRLIADEDLAARLSSNARQTVEAFDWTVLLDRWEEIFTDLRERRKTSRSRANWRVN